MSTPLRYRDLHTGSMSEHRRLFYARPFREMAKWGIRFIKVCLYRLNRNWYRRLRERKIVRAKKYARACAQEAARYISGHEYVEMQIGNATRKAAVLRGTQSFVFERTIEVGDAFLYGAAPLVEEYDPCTVSSWSVQLTIDNRTTKKSETLKAVFPYNNRSIPYAYYPGNGWVDMKASLAAHEGDRCSVTVSCKTDAPVQGTDWSISCPQILTARTKGTAKKVILISVESLTDLAYLSRRYGFAVPNNLEELRNESTVYENVYSPTESTLSFAASLHTGLMPSQHGIGNYAIPADSFHNNVFSRKLTTIAEYFKSRGFFTSFGGTQVRFSSKVGWARGFDHYYHVFEKWAGNVPRTEWIANTLRSLADFDTFICMHIDYLHDPLVSFGDADRTRFHDMRCLARTDEDHTADLYKAQLDEFDYFLGRLVSHLKDAGEYENTALIVTGDHGCGINWVKHSDYALYEERIRVPLMIKYPSWAETVVEPRRMTNSTSEIHRVLYAMMGDELPAYMRNLPQYDPAYAEVAFAETIMNPKRQFKRHNLAIIHPPYKYACWNEIDWHTGTHERSLKESLYRQEGSGAALYDEERSVLDRDRHAAEKYRGMAREIMTKNLAFMKEHVPERY